MLEVGWSEILVIAVILIVVVGPKDLPPMLRAFGKMTTRLRTMAGQFQTQFSEALKEADLDDVRKTIQDAQKLNPVNSLREAMNPIRQMGNELKADLQKSVAVPAPVASPVAAILDTAETEESGLGLDDILPVPEPVASVPSSVEPAAKPVVAAPAPAPVATATATADVVTAPTQAAPVAAPVVPAHPVTTPAGDAPKAKAAKSKKTEAAKVAEVPLAASQDKPAKSARKPKAVVESVARVEIAEEPSKPKKKKKAAKSPVPEGDA